MIEGSKISELETTVALIETGQSEILRVVYDQERKNEVIKQKPVPGQTASSVTIVSEKGVKSDVRNDKERAAYYAAIKEKQAKLNDSQREHVRKIMSEKIKANPQWTARDRGTLYLKVMDHVIQHGR